MKEQTEQKNIIVLGGGFGGVRCALDLDRKIPKEYQIIVIDKKGYHLPHWLLYEIATVHLSRLSRVDYDEVENIAAVPFKDIFKGTRVKFLQGTVEDVFLADKMIAVSMPSSEGSGHTTGMLRFEYLALALGSETNYFGIAGLKEGSYGLKDLDDSLNLRNALEELFAQKKPADNINIVIGGGGFTGVELAGELVGYLKKLTRKYGLSYKRVRISVVEAGECLLPGANDWLLKKALTRFARLGVAIVLESPIQKFTDGQVFLSGGRIMPADMLVWTAGVRANSFVEHLAGADLTKSCLAVTECLQLPKYPYAFGLGDNVFCFDQVRQCPVPATAQRAVDQGMLVAENIARIIARKPLIPYKPHAPAFIVPIGGKYALADIYGVHLEGVLAWKAKMLVGLMYLLSILPATKAFKLWWKSLGVYVRND